MLAAISLLTSSCATRSQYIEAEYVPPVRYADYSCAQLTQEAERVSADVRSLSDIQDRKASGDAGRVAAGVTLILVLLPLFVLTGADPGPGFGDFGEGSTGNEDEIARLKGEYRAIQEVAVQNDCSDLAAAIGGSRAAASSATTPFAATATADQQAALPWAGKWYGKTETTGGEASLSIFDGTVTARIQLGAKVQVTVGRLDSTGRYTTSLAVAESFSGAVTFTIAGAFPHFTIQSSSRNSLGEKSITVQRQ